MATVHTYTSLKTALQKWEESEGTKFAAQVDTMIGMGEAKLLRDLGIELFNARFPATMSSGNPLISRRTEFVAIRTVSIVDSSGEYKTLHKRSNEFLDEYWKVSSSTDEPEFYAEYDENSIRVAPTPDAAYSTFVRGVVRPTQLSSDNTSTWLSTKCGDLLFLACLIAAEIYIKEDLVSEQGRIAGLKREYDERLAFAKVELRLQENADYSPITATPDA